MHWVKFTNKNISVITKILRYVQTLTNPNNKIFECYRTVRNDYKIEYSIDFDNETSIVYDNHNIKIRNISTNQEDELSNESIYLSNTSIELGCDKVECIELLITDAIKYHYQDLNIKTEKDELKILQYEFDRWEEMDRIKKRKLESIFLPTSIKQDIIDDLSNFYDERYKERYNELGIVHSKVYMFHGPPGTGKTSLVHSLASFFNMQIALICMDNHMTDKSLKKLFERLPSKTVLLFEDVDCLFHDRDTTNTKNMITYSGLLNVLDGVVKKEEIVIILTTNYLEKLDKALKRRCDLIIKFNHACKSEIKQCYEYYYPDMNKFEEFYSKIEKKNVTINSLIKYFNRNLFEDVSKDKNIDNYLLNDKEESSLYM